MSLLPRRTALVVLAFVLAAGGTVVGAARITGPAAVPRSAAVRVDPPRPVVVIGDSAIAALRWVPEAAGAVVGFEHTLDLESCRRLLQVSCRGREGRVPSTVYDALEFHAGKYRVLVVATGYNDGTATFDDSFEAVVRRARAVGFDQIVWWTLRSDVDYVSPGSIGNHLTFARNNEVVRGLLASGRFPDVVLADWGAYTSDRPDWFVTDGVHYRALGAWAAADYLTRKMAFLEGRACPVPETPSSPVQDPCPDPDVTGPVADVAALYPVGIDGLLCYEVGQDRRFECRADTHVVQLTRELSEGMSGADVEAVQIRLMRLGLLADDATGAFGPGTAAAVLTFQSGPAALTATGVADVATLAALGFDTSAVTTVG